MHHPDVLLDLARAELRDRMADAAIRNRAAEGRRARYRRSPRRRVPEE